VRHAENPSLDLAVDSVADGDMGLDWDAVERGMPTEDGRKLVAQLRILARISSVHRSHAHEAAAADGGAGATAAMTPSLTSQTAESLRSVGDTKVIGRIEPQGGASGAADPTLAPWGSLQLLARVGEGTFGEVYRAFDTRLQREVAVKLLRPGRSPARLIDRVLGEARVLARLRHQNVVAIHGAEERDGRVGLCMEYVRGATLEQLLQTHGAFSAREAALIGQDLCRAIAAVHGAGLVHRDIKAQNVMREEGGRVVLMDFGAGQLRESAARGPARLTGTPLYLAPEVLNGGEATSRSDIYSLGVLLYHLVTGQFPVRGSSLDELRAAHAAGRFHRLHDVRPDLPEAFVQAVESAIASDPARRAASAGELQTLLGAAIGLQPQREPTTFARWPHPATWSRRAILAGAVAVASLLALVVWLALARTQPARPTHTNLVILPFDRGTGVEEYQVGEIERSLAEVLGASPGMRVAASDVGRSLKVRVASGEFAPSAIDFVLDGRFELAPGGLRASIALIPWGRSEVVWRRTLEAPAARMPEAMAAAVLHHVAPGAAPRAEAAPGSTYNDTAAELVARARYAYEHGRGREEKSIAYFKQAILADPNYARAHAGLARSYMTQGCDKSDEATAEAHLALGLDPGSAEAHAVLGDALLVCSWDWAGAEAAYRAALAANPSDAYARQRYAMFLAALGRTKEARQQLQQTRDLDFHSPTAAAGMAMLLYYDRQFAEAGREIQRAIDMDPQHARAYQTQGRILAAAGQFVEAGRSFAKALALDPDRVGPYLEAEIAAADAGAGRRAEALRFITEHGARPGSVPPEMLAFVYARLGQLDRAFEQLGRGTDQRSGRLLWLAVDPRADPLRGDPRFAALVGALHLPAK
jgi:eukaryotic-like serine/threonine-protein kinase